MPFPQNLRCGPSGWNYPDWNSSVYDDPSAPGRHRIEFLARYFDAIEINATSYQFIRPEVARLWVAKAAPFPRFLFSARLHRSFTHERKLEKHTVAAFREGILPLKRAGRLGCLLMQFPWAFRFTAENREYLIQLRRAFHEFPLVGEFRHASWTCEEARGTLIDYRVGFCNIDQAPFSSATPPTALLTSRVAYVRFHGRNPQDWEPKAVSAAPAPRHDYLYSGEELSAWKPRILSLAEHAPLVMVVMNNSAGGKSVVNALQMRRFLAGDAGQAPAGLLECYPRDLEEFHAILPLQRKLFAFAPGTDRAVA
jgi:uncharacterized protein YecE (DUF72 family)